MSEKLIFLHDIEGMFLIVEHASGVHYLNQVGGQICFEAKQEGVLAILESTPDCNNQLMDYPFRTGCQGITVEEADFIDRLLASDSSTSFLKVDRERLDESWEAWVFVRIGQVPDRWAMHDKYFGSIYGFSGGRGVLTWPNSD